MPPGFGGIAEFRKYRSPGDFQRSRPGHRPWKPAGHHPTCVCKITGSEVTPFAVITDESTGVKYPLADYELLSKMAIVDADMMMNVPRGLTAASGIDAVTHALEAYASQVLSGRQLTKKLIPLPDNVPRFPE